MTFKLKRILRVALYSLLGLSFTVVVAHFIADYQGQKSLLKYRESLYSFSSEVPYAKYERAPVTGSSVSGNAYPVYLQATGMLRETNGNSYYNPPENLSAYWGERKANLVGIEAEVAPFEPTLHKLREALHHKWYNSNPQIRTVRTCTPVYFSWSDRISFDLYQCFPLFAGAARLEQESGDHQEAINLLLDSIQVSLDPCRGQASFDLARTSVIVNRLGRELLSILIDGNLENSERDRVERAVSALRDSNNHFLKCWRFDLHMWAYNEVYLVPGRHSIHRMVGLDPGENNSAVGWSRLTHEVRTCFSLKASAARMASLYAEMEGDLDKLALDYDPVRLSKAGDLIWDYRSRDIYMREVADNIMRSIVAAFHLEATLRILELACHAARHYSLHGAWPTSLDELPVTSGVPDPFTGEQFGYLGGSSPKFTAKGFDSYPRLYFKGQVEFEPLK